MADADFMSGSASEAPPSSNTTATDTKIKADLVVNEKMQLCVSMLNPGQGLPQPSIQHDEAIKGVIGFLEACAPRLVELISADPGLLGEAVLMDCFAVQEQLTKVLEQVETLALTETSASTTAASAAPKSLGQMDLFDTGVSATAAPPANAKTTGEEDPFGNVVSGGGASKSDIDDFLS
jgi:hypothetical protein